MNKISVNTLGKVALAGGFLIPIVGYGMRWFIQEKIKRSASHAEVVEIVKNHEETKQLLGEPFKIGRIDIGDNSCWGQEGNIKWFTLPIAGPKAFGSLIYWVTIADEANNEFHVSRIQVKVQERNNKLKKNLLIRDNVNTDESIKKELLM